MDAMSFSAARKQLKATMDRVCRDRAPVTIIRQRGEPIVMLSLEDYNSLMETLHLLRNPRNAERLTEAMADARKGHRIHERALDEA